MGSFADTITKRGGTASATETKALGAVVHHTAMLPKTKTEEETLAVIESIHLGNGWADIGYNFVVMRSGRVFEGRRGSLESAKAGRCRRGAHAGKGSSFNQTHHGVCLEGNFGAEDSIPKEQREALVALLVWLSESCRFESGAIVTHRDVRKEPTECPGLSVATIASVVTSVQETQKSAAAHEMSETADLSLGSETVRIPLAGPSRVDLLGDGLLSAEMQGGSWVPTGPLHALMDGDAKQADGVVHLPWVAFDTELDLPFADGAARLGIVGSLQLRYAPETRVLSLWAKKGATVDFGFRLAMRGNLGLGGTGGSVDLQVSAWSEPFPLQPCDDAGFPFRTSFSPDDDAELFRITLPTPGEVPDDWEKDGDEWFARHQLTLPFKGAASKLRMPGFGGLVGELEIDVETWAFHPRSASEPGKVELTNLSLAFTGLPKAKFEAAYLRADDTFHVTARGGRFELLLAQTGSEAFVLDPAATDFTLVLHADTEFVLVVSSAGVSLEARTDKGRIATVAVPALTKSEVEVLIASHDMQSTGTGETRSLMFEVRGEADSALSLSSTGIHAVAVAAPVRLALGKELKDVTLTEGRLQLSGRRWSATATATAGLPWLEGARGELLFETGSDHGGLAVDARFDVPLGDVWRDPSGVLAFHEPAASINVAWDGQWHVDGSLSGELRFDASKIASEAKEIASDVLDRMSLSFEGLSLSSLGSLGSDGNGSVRLDFLKPFEGDIWDIFRFRLTSFHLTSAGAGLGGTVAFNLGPVQFGGEFPALNFSFTEGRGLSLSDDFDFGIDGALKLAGGVEAQMSFRKRKDDTLESLDGAGSLRVPRWGDFGVALSVGRTSAGQPSVFIFGDLDMVQPLYPGVVLRKAGLGFGINRGFGEDLSGRSPAEILEHLRTTRSNDVMAPAAWEVRDGVQLVMRGMFSATTGPNDEPDMYVADLTATLDERFRLTAVLDGWAFTKLDDAPDPSFRNRPFVRGALVVDPKAPSLAAGMLTRKGSKHSLEGAAGELVSALLDARELEAMVRADPSRFALRITQHDALNILGIRLRATQTLALCASRKGAWMAARATAGASFSTRIPASAGPVSASITASVTVNAELGVLGAIVDSKLCLYGVASMSARFTLHAKLEIRIRIRFKIGPFKVGVKVRVKARSVEVGQTATLRVQASIGQETGYLATAEFGARLGGYELKIPFSIRKNPDAVKRAHSAYREALTSGGSL